MLAWRTRRGSSSLPVGSALAGAAGGSSAGPPRRAPLPRVAPPPFGSPLPGAPLPAGVLPGMALAGASPLASPPGRANTSKFVAGGSVTPGTIFPAPGAGGWPVPLPGSWRRTAPEIRIPGP
jgi:hypothetical protein